MNFKSVHIQVENQTVKEGTKSQEFLRVSKELWDFLLKHQIMITAEYLPGCLNHQADWESRNQKDSTEWKLCLQVFQKNCQKVGQQKIDLFPSRLSNHLPAYYSWKLDPDSLALDALQQTWSHKHLYAFPPFSLMHRVLRKVDLEKVHSVILITPIWQSQTWYPEVIRLSMKNRLLLPQHPNFLRNPQGETHSLL